METSAKRPASTDVGKRAGFLRYGRSWKALPQRIAHCAPPAGFRDPAGDPAGNLIPPDAHGNRIAGVQQENTQGEPDGRESE